MSKSHRLQSAMEYLMTYGWAILAIAVVMVSLYSLGIFNIGNLKPTATPGSCQVIRTTVQTSLAGQCGNLIPRYVAQLSGTTSSYINAGNRGQLSTTGSLTVSAWVETPVAIAGEVNFVSRYNTYSCSYSWSVRTLSGIFAFTVDFPAGTDYNSQGTTSPAVGKWYMVTGVFDSSQQKVNLYVNGTMQKSISGPSAIGSTICNVTIGTTRPTYTFKGLVSNVQIYNTSLDNASIKTLYQSGIGGAPVDLQHIVGWWPLNGNANDYSGNNNQGTASSVVWNANWQNGYSNPS